jgi:6-aminohexanoate-oligomer exohydrolase
MRPDGVTLDDWQRGPANRWAFQHVDQVVPTTPVPRGVGPQLELTSGPAISIPGLEAFLSRTWTDGLLVMHGREVLLERYLNGMTASTRHLLQSVSKSMCSAIVGRYVDSGALAVDALVQAYVPELAGSAYGDATVQQVLDMTVGVLYDETYADPASAIARHERAGGWRTPIVGDPADTYAFLASLRKSGEHGRTFAYCSANTDVLGWILERVSGRRYADLLAMDLWSRLGAEYDAYVTVDGAGFAAANGGMCVTLRDLARFGRVVLDGGTGPEGDVVIPAAWIADIRHGGDPAVTTTSTEEAPPAGSYRDQFWITEDEHGCFFGIGIYGQYVWLNPVADLVVAKLSSLPTADDTDDLRTHLAFFEGLANILGA